MLVYLNEIWRKIPDDTLYRYEISDHCRVKNIITNNILMSNKTFQTLHCGTNKIEVKSINIIDTAMKVFKTEKPSVEYIAFFEDGNNENKKINNIIWKKKDEVDGLNYENEIWMQVTLANFDTYSISNYSRIKSSLGNVLTPNSKQQITLYNNNSQITKQVYELTVLSFIGNKPTLSHTVDHIDRNYNNNHLSNLRWATKKEQANNRKNTNPRGIELEYVIDDKIINYKSISEASRALNIAEHVLRLKIRKNETNIINNGNLSVKRINVDEQDIKQIPNWIYKHECIPDNPINVCKDGLISINGYWTKGSQLCRKEEGQYFTINIKNVVYKMHKLIAAAFIGRAPIDDKGNIYIVNHKDLDGLNNNIINLEYLSQKGNCEHAILAGARKTKPVLEYLLDGTFVKEHISLREAARCMNITHRDIAKCCNGNCKRYKNRIWKYKLGNDIQLKINAYSITRTSCIQYDNNNPENEFDKWFNLQYKFDDTSESYISIKHIFENFEASSLYYKRVAFEQFVKIIAHEHPTLKKNYHKKYYTICNTNKNKQVKHAHVLTKYLKL